MSSYFDHAPQRCIYDPQIWDAHMKQVTRNEDEVHTEFDAFLHRRVEGLQFEPLEARFPVSSEVSVCQVGESVQPTTMGWHQFKRFL